MKLCRRTPSREPGRRRPAVDSAHRPVRRLQSRRAHGRHIRSRCHACITYPFGQHRPRCLLYLAVQIGSGWPAPAVAGRLLSPPCASAIAPTPPQAQARLRVAPTRPLVDYRSLLSCSWRSRMNCRRTQTRGASAPQTCRPIAPHPPPIARASYSVPARVCQRLAPAPGTATIGPNCDCCTVATNASSVSGP